MTHEVAASNNGNYAAYGSTQNNKIYIVHNWTFQYFLEKHSIDMTSMNPNPDPALLNFLKNSFPFANRPMRAEPLLSDSSSPRESQEDKDLLQEWFPSLRPFDNELRTAAASYHVLNGTSYVRMLPESRSDVIQRFIASNESNILLLSGSQITTHFMTNITLEVLGVVDTSRRKYNYVHSQARMFHFCGVNTIKKGARPELMIQDLLFQLLRHQKNNNPKQGYGKLEAKLRETRWKAPNDVRALWLLFGECIQLTGLQSIVILLDNLHSLFFKCRENGNETMQNFDCFVQQLKLLVSQSPITVKVMITAQSDELAHYLQQPFDPKG